MPVTYQIDKNESVIRTWCSGTVTLPEVLALSTRRLGVKASEWVSPFILVNLILSHFTFFDSSSTPAEEG